MRKFIAQPEHTPAKADAPIPVPAEWLAQIKTGDRVRLTDSRGASRSLTISGFDGNSRWAESSRTAYIVPGSHLSFSLALEGESQSPCALLGWEAFLRRRR